MFNTIANENVKKYVAILSTHTTFNQEWEV